MMHKLFLLVILFCFCIIAKANTNQTNLVVWAKDGERVAYTLREKPKITFTEADLVIKVKGVELYYSLENMDRFTYESNSDNTSTYWDEFSGTVDDIKNPHKIIGSRHEGCQNAVYNRKEYMGKLTMTR